MRAAQQAKNNYWNLSSCPNIWNTPFSILPTLNITSNSKRVNPSPLDRKRIEFWRPNAHKKVLARKTLIHGKHCILHWKEAKKSFFCWAKPAKKKEAVKRGFFWSSAMMINDAVTNAYYDDRWKKWLKKKWQGQNPTTSLHFIFSKPSLWQTAMRLVWSKKHVLIQL